MKLNHNYDGKTRLRHWHPIVKENFQKIEAHANSVDASIEREARERQAADAALQQAIADEAAARSDADAALDGKISAERTARENADAALQQKINDEAAARVAVDNALGQTIADEAAARERADNVLQASVDSKAPINHRGTNTSYGAGDSVYYGHVKLSDSVGSASDIAGGTAATPKAVKAAYDKAADVQTQIAAEITERKNADNTLKSAVETEQSDRQNADNLINAAIAVLQNKAHEHHNKDVLDKITEEHITFWEDIYNFRDFATNQICGIVNELQNLYTAIGVTLFDGGLFGTEQTGLCLDGGSFTDTDLAAFDCGGFEPIIVTGEIGAVIDGGQY